MSILGALSPQASSAKLAKKSALDYRQSDPFTGVDRILHENVTKLTLTTDMITLLPGEQRIKLIGRVCFNVWSMYFVINIVALQAQCSGVYTLHKMEMTITSNKMQHT